MRHTHLLALALSACVGLSAFSWEITYDGKPLRAGERAWTIENGQVMVALEDLRPDVIDAYSLNFDGWQITIIAQGFGITGMVTSPVLKRDGFAATFTAAPTIKDRILWFPIESLATVMNCTVEKSAAARTLRITSPLSAASREQALDIQGRRMTSLFNNMSYFRPPIEQFEDILVPGARGLLPARLYDPEPAVKTARAVYVNIHGGGYNLGSIGSSDHVCRDIANRSGQKVLSIEYGMLPEHPFPEGWEDAYAAVEWLYGNAERLGIDPERIFVGGDSAGATIANAVAMMARDRGKFTVAGMALAYPVVDMTASWAAFVFKDPKDAQNPYATPKNGRLQGMPSTLLLIAETDGLRPQAEEYAALLKQAGVKVDSTVVGGTKHGFLATHADSRESVAQFVKNARK